MKNLVINSLFSINILELHIAQRIWSFSRGEKLDFYYIQPVYNISENKVFTNDSPNVLSLEILIWIIVFQLSFLLHLLVAPMLFIKLEM